MNNKPAYPNCLDLQLCFNCSHSDTMCDELICRWHESYVVPIGKCSWWVKKEVLSGENSDNVEKH